MTNHDALVEKIARAVRADLYEEAESPHNQTGVLRDFYALKIANHELLMKNTLAAIDSSGTHVVVPVEPTEEMAAGGSAVILATWVSSDGFDEEGIADEFEVYRAMISARPKVKS